MVTRTAIVNFFDPVFVFASLGTTEEQVLERHHQPREPELFPSSLPAS